nr:glycoside hydrolase family 36 N-terminal domain-containing protein [Akkermansia muciniphila]
MIPDSVHLLTRSSQMTLYKDEQGRVRRAYYGPRLREPEDALENAADAPLLYSSLADSVTGLPNASGEYCICVTQADGALSLSLECLGWEVLELDDDREEAVFYGKDPSYPVRVEIHVRSHRESDTFLQWAVIRNEGKEGIRLHRAASAQLGLRAERYFVTSFRGTWGGES